MAIDVKQYIEQLAQTAGLSQEEKEGILKVAANEKFAKGLEENILLRSDYSRSMDALKAEKAQWSDFYQKTLTTHEQNQKVVDEYARKVADYEAQLGTADPNAGQRTMVTTPMDSVSRKDFEAALSKQEANSLSLFKIGLKLQGNHIHEFKEPLDIDALTQKAIDQQMPLQQAYDEMVKPKRDAASQAQTAATIARERDEAVKEFASKNRIPIDVRPKEGYSPILDQDRTKQVEYDDKTKQLTLQGGRTLRSNFLESWNSGSANTSGGSS